MKIIKLKDAKGHRLYPFTTTDAVIGLTNKIDKAIEDSKKSTTTTIVSTSGSDKRVEDVELGTLDYGTYQNSKFVSNPSHSTATSISMKSFLLLPYLGVTFNFKLPEDYVVDVYYGNNYGASGTTCNFGINCKTGLKNGYGIYFPNIMPSYETGYSDDINTTNNIYYYGIVFRKKDNSVIKYEDLTAHIANKEIRITYENPYGSIIERNRPAMDNIVAASMYFELGHPKRFNDIFLHISDLHGNIRGLKDCITLAKELKAKAIFVTGDIVPQSSDDNFDWFNDTIEDIDIPILWCTGNHDGVGMELSAFNKVFYNTSSYEVSDKGYHYYDLTSEKIRVIALDCSDTTEGYRINSIGSTQIAWLETTLADAKSKGLGVIIIDHQPMGTTKTSSDHPKFCVTGNNGNDFTGSDDVKSKVDSFISSGGEFIMYCNGHGHCDHAGYLPNTSNNQLQFNIASSTFATASLNCDTPRDFGKGRAGDMINAYAVDRIKKTVTVVRFGNQLTTNGVIRDKDTFIYSSVATNTEI